MPYRVEYASSARAGCKGPMVCTKIGKGELRVGTLVEINGKSSFAWRHWGCVTEKILSNMKDGIGEAKEFDGYEELKEVDQQKIEKAFEVGHVADEDIPDSARKPEGEEKPKKAGGRKKNRSLRKKPQPRRRLPQRRKRSRKVMMRQKLRALVAKSFRRWTELLEVPMKNLRKAPRSARGRLQRPNRLLRRPSGRRRVRLPSLMMKTSRLFLPFLPPIVAFSSVILPPLVDQPVFDTPVIALTCFLTSR
ncbi:hypothetical protein DL96DRAFT_1606239 [Flagelloscypha sp. PMI_526]|nr:hypothetical protein DL96DRAFT_1606239 [Flagelloscypha sp. PMI_526]